MGKNSRTQIFMILLVAGCMGPFAFAGETCTGDFTQAERMVQESKGSDIQLDKLPQVEITVQKKKVITQLKRDGDSVFLHAIVPNPLMSMEFDVPVQVCADGTKLTAKVVMSAGKIKGVPLTRALNVPNEVKLVIVRNENNLYFNTEDGTRSPPVPIAGGVK